MNAEIGTKVIVLMLLRGRAFRQAKQPDAKRDGVI